MFEFPGDKDFDSVLDEELAEDIFHIRKLKHQCITKFEKAYVWKHQDMYILAIKYEYT